jgi:uncharacterized membrane protein YcaP (DUF421 family)
LVVRLLYNSPKLERIVEGTDDTLILNGVIDHAAMHREMLSQDELLAVIHRQGFDDFDEVEECSIGPNGQFYVRGRHPSQEDERHSVLIARLDDLSKELRELKLRLSSSGAGEAVPTSQ